MIAIDLFCGRGGWTDGLMAQGFTVYGFDINPQPEYKGIFVQADILAMTIDDLKAYKPDFAVCSSPCEQFSVHCMKHFHPNPKHPEIGIRLFEHSRELLEGLGVPYVMENVRCAEKFVGKAVNHCGPFYLWGTGVPAVMFSDNYKLQKGIQLGTGAAARQARAEGRLTEYRVPYAKWNNRNKVTAAAKVATIPEAIASAVAELARNHVEMHKEASWKQ